MKFEGNLTLEHFWMDWFGIYGGREIGSNPPYPAHRRFSDNPAQLVEDIKFCEEHTLPIWITAQPFSAYGTPCAIERLFFDFDDDSRYCPECDKWWPKKDFKHIQKMSKKDRTLICVKHKIEVILKPQKEIIGREVIQFLNRLPRGIIPLVVETHKGYHVWIFLRKIFTFKKENIEMVKEIYKKLVDLFIGEKEYIYLDKRVKELMRLARVPLSIHEKWGERCRILKLRDTLLPDKVRDVSYYRQNGLTAKYIEIAVQTWKREQEKKMKQKLEMMDQAKEDMMNPRSNGFVDEIRPCFQARWDAGVMDHSMRLAFLRELYNNGYKCDDEEKTEEKMVQAFEKMHDFKESKSRYYVRYFLDHDPDAFPPYRCDTMQDKGWCIEDECPKWSRDRAKHLKARKKN